MVANKPLPSVLKVGATAVQSTSRPASPAPRSETAALWKACLRFEAFFVTYLVQQMWRAAEALGGEKPFTSQAYRELFTFELAEELTPHLRFGLADALYRSLRVGTGDEGRGTIDRGETNRLDSAEGGEP